MTQRKEFHNSRAFSSPSPVVHPEVSAQWTRDGRGEVLISLKVPWDIVDAELFVKTTKGHFGILMDPWSSSSWRKYWSQQHTPNKITKEKIQHLRQVKAERRISLHRTAGQTSLTTRSQDQLGRQPHPITTPGQKDCWIRMTPTKRCRKNTEET